MLVGPATSGQTDPNSSLAFLGFSPGENFVKPDLEEWEFALRSKLIAVEMDLQGMKGVSMVAIWPRTNM